MSDEIVYPRSPRETMAGWMYLPRFVDKIRLHFAGKLHPDYQPNLAKPGSFDGMWLEASGVSKADFFEVVKASATDGEVCDWVLHQVKVPDEAKWKFREALLGRGQNDEFAEKLEQRKKESGMEHRDDIQCFVDYIDADEGRF